MNYFATCIARLVLALIIAMAVSAPGITAEIDDAAVFVEAFNAFQQKDFLLVIEKCDQLNLAFPDSPLRDVTLLLTARASLRSGDHERAAKTAALFSAEFPDSSLKTTIEDELKVLVRRLQKGEALPADRVLQTAAVKVKNDRLAREREAALRLETERAARAKAEQDRLARIKLEEERRENERLLAEKRAKAEIRVAIITPEAIETVPVGGNGTLPLEITNTGKATEEFLLTVASANGYNAVLSRGKKSDENMARLQLAPGETGAGNIRFTMPNDMVDGHRTVMSVKAVSSKYGDVSFQKDVTVITSAPLVRAVAKLGKPTVVPGENLHYRVTVLNAGSLPARDLTVRLKLPPQVEFLSAPDLAFKQEADATLVFTVDQVEMGKLVEYNLGVRIRENSPVGQELRGQVEIINNSLHRKEVFKSSPTIVRAK